MLLCMTDLLGLLLSTILVLWIELIESALEHLVDIVEIYIIYYSWRSGKRARLRACR